MLHTKPYALNLKPHRLFWSEASGGAHRRLLPLVRLYPWSAAAAAAAASAAVAAVAGTAEVAGVRTASSVWTHCAAVKASKVRQQTQLCVDFLESVCCRRVQQQQRQQQQEEEGEELKKHHVLRVQPWYVRPGPAAAAAARPGKQQLTTALGSPQQPQQQQQYAHLSLSRLLLLQRHLLEPFVAALEKALKDLKALLSAVDSVVEAFGFERFWQPFKPHVSLASTSTAVEEGLRLLTLLSGTGSDCNNSSSESSSGSSKDSSKKRSTNSSKKRSSNSSKSGSDSGSTSGGLYLLVQKQQLESIVANCSKSSGRWTDTWVEVESVCVTIGKRTTQLKLNKTAGGLASSSSSGSSRCCCRSSGKSSERQLMNL
ncbi:hypothetical protein Esti_003490 [Eimeria stiedai]